MLSVYTDGNRSCKQNSLHIVFYMQSVFIYSDTAVTFQAHRLFIRLKGGQIWLPNSKCDMKLWTWSVKSYLAASHSNCEPYIYLSITVTQFSNSGS